MQTSEITDEEFNKMKIFEKYEDNQVLRMKDLKKLVRYKIIKYKWTSNMNLILTLESGDKQQACWGNSKMKKLFKELRKPTYFQIEEHKRFNIGGKSVEYVDFSYITGTHLVEEEDKKQTLKRISNGEIDHDEPLPLTH